MSTLTPKKILIAEANGAIRKLLAFYLGEQGYATVTAGTTRRAWKAIGVDKPDLVILNVTLPKDNGLRLLKKVRASPGLEELPVIVLSEIRKKEVVMAMAQLGVVHYLLSPQLNLDTLVAVIAEALDAEPSPAEGGEERGTGDEDSSAETDGDGPAADTNDDAETDTDAEVTSDSDQDPAEGKTGLDLEGVSCLKDIKPVIKRSVIQEALDECGDLKGMSPAVAKVLKLTKKENCSISAVAKAVKKDQGVSLKLLKLANSSVYERGDPVDSIPQAIMRMGLESVRQAALNLSVIDQFKEAGDPRLDAALFWEHSIATGLIAAEATRATGGNDDQIDSAFTMGLLHDSGRMVYNEMFPQEYRQVLDAAEHLNLPLHKVESRLLLVNHAECMDRVLRAWHFPKHLIDPIALHHLSAGNIRRMAPKVVKECCILALSNALAHTLLLGHSGSHCIYPLKSYMKTLGLGREFIDQITAEVPDQTQDMKLAMLANSGGVSIEYVKQLNDQLNQPIHPLVITRDDEINPVQMMLDRLLEQPNEESSPNLAVVYATSKKEIPGLTRKLKQVEQDADVSGLPVIVISGSGEGQIDESTSESEPRPQRRAAMPLHVGHFVELANSLLAEKSAASGSA